MSKSLLARGLGKIKRRREREQKQAARARYKEFRMTLPVDPKTVVLEARNGRAIDGNIFYILQELLQGAAYRDLQIHVVVEDETAERSMRAKIEALPAADDRIRYVRLLSEDYYRLMATAGYIVNDATIANFFIKREGQIYLNVWHGTPLKTMGRRVSHEPHATGNVQKNFIIADFLLYPSDYMMEHMVEDYMIADVSGATILMGGYPRNAAFFREEQRLAIRQAIASKGQRIYAYMPTWRPSLMGAALQDILTEMDRGLQPGEVMYVNLHPLAEESVDFGAFRSVRPFPDAYENYAVLNAADALLTDYSSVFYDFAVSGRKIVLLTYDEEEYFATRGLYEPIDALPFPQTKTVAEALDQLRAPKEYDDSAFLRKYCAYEGPDAAEMLCRQVFLGEACMEMRPMPRNGRPVCLVYGGDLREGERTEEVLRLLADPNKPEGNYYLTFNRGDLKDHFQVLLRLPEGIRYIGRAGKMALDPVQQEAQDRYDRGKISFKEYWDCVRPAFALERARNYGNMPIDQLIQIPAGKTPGPDATKEELEFSTYEIGT